MTSRLALILALLAAPLGAAPTPPRTPDEELATFRLADSRWQIECVAAEPEVSSPVALAWDELGRLWVAEMRDYPNATFGGAIRRLEDTNGDGRADTSVVFAEALPFPNSILPWRGGVLVTAAPDLWFLRDNDGDGKADERKVLFTGFGTGNQQLRANGLFWGLDGWVYGANGRSDGEIRRQYQPRWTNGILTVEEAPSAGSPVSLRGRDFRFRAGYRGVRNPRRTESVRPRPRRLGKSILIVEHHSAPTRSPARPVPDGPPCIGLPGDSPGLPASW